MDGGFWVGAVFGEGDSKAESSKRKTPHPPRSKQRGTFSPPSGEKSEA